MKKVAVFLSGCGYLDGAEIRESVFALTALSKAGAQVQCFAPDQNQSDVVNHVTAQATSETRNILQEAARIARGKIRLVSEFHANDFDAAVFPGGFGVAKSFCTFATQGSGASVDLTIEAAVQQINKAGKPIGAICISPALVALCLKEKKLTLTLGAPGEASQEVEKLGHKHVECSTSDCVVDRDNKLVTTPAYMYDDGKIHEIFTGIEKCVSEALKMA